MNNATVSSVHFFLQRESRGAKGEEKKEDQKKN